MRILKFIREYLIEYSQSLILFSIISLISWGIDMYLPLINGRFIDLLVEKNFSRSIVTIIILIAVLNISKIGMTYFINIIYSKLSANITFKITYKVLNHIKLLPINFFYNKNSAYLNQRINMDSSNIADFTVNNIRELLVNIISFILSIYILMTINLKITSILIILIPGYLLLYTLFRKKLYKSNFKYKEFNNRLFGDMNSQIDNIKFIKINSLTEILNDRLKLNFKELLRSYINLTRVSTLFSNCGMLINVLANIVILLIGINEIIKNSLTIGQFTIIGTYFGIILKSIEYFLSFSKVYQNVNVSYDRLSSLLELDIEIDGKETLEKITKIELINLDFSYNKENNLISKFNYTFTLGNIYKINGANGKGKSTLINILIGLYNNYEGIIKYNGINILNINMYEIRKTLISMVEQEPMLLNDSILNNLTYNLKEYREKDIESIMNILNLNDVINNLEKGLYTEVTDKVYNFSGGEKQKISLTRALLKKPNLLILDEVNSALDADSILNLVNLLNKIKKDKIIIIISHTNSFDSIIDYNIEL